MWVHSLGWEDPLEESTATQAFFPGQRSLEDFSPWGLKGLDMTEQLSIAQQPLNQINEDNQVDESEKAGMVHTITAGSAKGMNTYKVSV